MGSMKTCNMVPEGHLGRQCVSGPSSHQGAAEWTRNEAGAAEWTGNEAGSGSLGCHGC